MNRTHFAYLFVLIMTYSISYAQDKNIFIKYFAKAGYNCIEFSTLEELKEDINNGLEHPKEIKYWTHSNMVLGLIISDNHEVPSLFIANEKHLSYFIPNPFIDITYKEHLFTSLIRINFSVYHINLLTKTIYDLPLNYFPTAESSNIADIYIFKNNTYTKYYAPSKETTPLPNFVDEKGNIENYNPIKKLKFKQLKEVESGKTIVLKPNALAELAGMLL